MYINKAIDEMKLVFKELPYGIDHTMRVLKNTEEIIKGEAIDDKSIETVKLAAVLHDVGAIEALGKYGSIDGPFQEIEGPPVARNILEPLDVPHETINRVCYIVGHHHSPSEIDGIDFQILWEADFLDSLEFGEPVKNRGELQDKITENFKTVTGRKLALKRLGFL